MSKSKNQKKKGNKNKKSTKKKYKIRNWREYNQSLVDRGRLDVWIEECVLENWHPEEPSGKPGAPTRYNDIAITTTLQFGQVFGQKLRQTEGLVNSIFELMGLEQKVPDHSTLSRRGKTAAVALPKNNSEKLVLLVDSSGLKVFGEGEWKVRKHGFSKHRTWRKMHLMITPDGTVRQAELTGNEVSDDEVAVELLEQEQSEVESLAGDGAFDRKKVYDKCRKKGIKKILIPPQVNAKIWQHGNCQAPPHPRDENLRQIRRTSRKKWKQTSGFHIRSLSETAMFRFKTIFGDKLKARDFLRQRTEFLIKIAALNKMTRLGMPDSYAVTG